MVSVTGMTVARINQELDEMVVAVSIDELGQLIYEKRSGEEINAGSLTNPALAVNKAYPVGSLYISTVPTNPADAGMLGVGTWVRYGKGRTLVSLDEAQTEFDSVGEEGGEKTHVLTTAELPAHTHTINHDHASFNSVANGGHSHSISVKFRDDLYSTGGSKEAITGVGGAEHGDVDGSDVGVTTTVASHQHTIDIPSFTGSSGSAGTGAAHNNLPPYIVVYIWRRTA